MNTKTCRTCEEEKELNVIENNIQKFGDIPF